ncbi:prominin-1-A-like [Crassostrea angulata]|uniref:prominin-1-A-like n=1 Tax=Magallana angulata TaxID=2784310 RepID=UPI0022B14364|nr:prominin-1-A-like [Crassostrea angulata]
MALRSLCVVLLVVLAPPALAATITDTYGNVAYDNGTMSWADLPSGIPYKTNNVYDEGSLKPLFSLVHGFINTIQPNAFPFSLIKQVLNGSFDISAQYMELVNYAMGFGICFVLGLLFIVFLPLCGCCFCCCRCCGNCGGNGKQIYEENEGCKRMGLAQALFLMAVVMAASAGCVYMTNDRFTVALQYADTSIANNLDDIMSYVNNTGMQFKYVAVDMYAIVADALIRDISGIGSVLATAIFNVLNIDPVINAVISLDQSLSAIKTALDQVVTDQTALTSAANALDSALKTLKSDIDSTKSGCNGQCSPNTVCDAIDTSVLAVSIDFSAIPDLSSTQSTINSVIANNLTGLALTAKANLDNMESTINSSTSSIQSSLQSTLDTFKTTLNTMVDSLLAQLSGAFDSSSLKADSKSFFETALTYDVYRQYFGYGLMGLFTLIPVLNIVGICCGCLCGDGDAIPTKRGCGSSCGGCLMMMSVALMFLIGSMLMFLTTLTFMIGGNFEKICQTFLDLTIFKDFIDAGAISSISLGSMLLGDPNANISIYKALLGCRQNKAPFELFSLDTLVPIDNYLNYSQYMGDIDTQINSISTSIDLSSFQILSKDLENTLNDFKNSGIGNLNFTVINDTLNQDLGNIDFNALIATMETIKSSCTGPTLTKWNQHIADTETIRDTTYPAVTTAKTNLQTSMGSLESAVSGIVPKIDDVLTTAKAADDVIQNNVSSLLTTVALSYKNQILGYIDSYIARTRYLIFFELAACLPLWNLYDSFTTMFCKYTMDALNAFWFSIGWGLLFFIPVIVIAVKLSKYYRKMDKCEGYGEDDDDDDAESSGTPHDYDNYGRIFKPNPEPPRYQYRKTTDF